MLGQEASETFRFRPTIVNKEERTLTARLKPNDKNNDTKAPLTEREAEQAASRPSDY